MIPDHSPVCPGISWGSANSSLGVQTHSQPTESVSAFDRREGMEIMNKLCEGRAGQPQVGAVDWQLGKLQALAGQHSQSPALPGQLGFA